MNLLNESFSSQSKPLCNVCIDETLVPFRERKIMRQYIKSKSHSYGLKLFKFCSGLGCTHKILLYSGKSDFMWKPENVVFELMSDYLNQGHILTTDNQYTFLSLARALLERKTYLVGKLQRFSSNALFKLFMCIIITGTLRLSRIGIPPEVKSFDVKLREFRAFGNQDGIMVGRWKDHTRSKSKTSQKKVFFFFQLSTTAKGQIGKIGIINKNMINFPNFFNNQMQSLIKTDGKLQMIFLMQNVLSAIPGEKHTNGINDWQLNCSATQPLSTLTNCLLAKKTTVSERNLQFLIFGTKWLFT